MKNLALLVRPSAVFTIHLPSAVSKVPLVTTVLKEQSFFTPITSSTWSKYARNSLKSG